MTSSWRTAEKNKRKRDKNSGLDDCHNMIYLVRTLGKGLLSAGKHPGSTRQKREVATMKLEIRVRAKP